MTPEEVEAYLEHIELHGFEEPVESDSPVGMLQAATGLEGLAFLLYTTVTPRQEWPPPFGNGKRPEQPAMKSVEA